MDKILKQKKSKYLQTLWLLGILFVCGIIIIATNPTAKLKIYKLFYVKYVRITKGDFSHRFTAAELTQAIEHAKNQPWVQAQIAADLEPYKQGITKEQLQTWFVDLQHQHNQLALFKVYNKKVSVELPQQLREKRSFKTVYSIVELLAQNGSIPDCEFIVALNDFLSYVPADYSEPAAILSFAKHTGLPVERDTILIPDWMNTRYWDVLKGRIDLANKVFSWNKKLELIHWRGGSADSMLHRRKLVALNSELEFLDVAMTEGSTPAAFVDPEFSLKYKYQISLDGARCTWERMIWQMQSNTVLLKPYSPQMQWFHRGLQPYVNYVPLEDISKDQITAAYTWLQANDQKAHEISLNANKFAQDNFKTQDFFAYYAVLLQEYAKLML